ncbi:MAG: multifunctional CCA addition/repair protein [Legionellaceae bacterium]|nr:multifunctional CCA addition/repair protein [Legionellaceae bacterium]
MKIYLVGGAVRDSLLGLPIQERDWVVVGATPQDLLSKGFETVGRDFPVFLHPKSKEEYALARTERKSGSGYTGFICDSQPNITLEEDLSRRDLTINAIAQDPNGQLIDPFQGQKDIQAKILRHVSPAFIEDPVRVLRVARFMARFHSLGFTLAAETRQLMTHMVQQGELEHLTPERVFLEWQKSLQEKNPEQFILTLRACGALRVVLPELNTLFGVPQQNTLFSNKDCGMHTLQALQNASMLSLDPQVRFSAITTLLGKALTSPSQWPEHPDYPAHSVTLIARMAKRLRIPKLYSEIAQKTALLHAPLAKRAQLSAEELFQLLQQSDAFRKPQLFMQILLASQAQEIYAQQSDAQTRSVALLAWGESLLKTCLQLNLQSIIHSGLTGEALGAAIRKARIDHLQKNFLKKDAHVSKK